MQESDQLMTLECCVGQASHRSEVLRSRFYQCQSVEHQNC